MGQAGPGRTHSARAGRGGRGSAVDAGADAAELAGRGRAQERDGEDADDGDQSHQQGVLHQAGALLAAGMTDAELEVAKDVDEHGSPPEREWNELPLGSPSVRVKDCFRCPSQGLLANGPIGAWTSTPAVPMISF